MFSLDVILNFSVRVRVKSWQLRDGTALGLHQEDQPHHAGHEYQGLFLVDRLTSDGGHQAYHPDGLGKDDGKEVTKGKGPDGSNSQQCHP